MPLLDSPNQDGPSWRGLYQNDRVLGLILLLVVSISAGFLGGWLGAKNNPGASSTSATKQVVLSEGELISQIAKDVGPSVVSISVTSQGNIVNPFFNFGQPIQQQSAGTGFIISADGIVVTNRHVIPRGASAISITLSDGTRLDDVELIGRTNDQDTLDVAFLKIKDAKGKKLAVAKIGDSAKMEIGYRVVTIGNALGQFQNTVTSGIISGYGRSVTATDGAGSAETLQNLFQTDAAINQGNSGGPLVNMNGEVIAINTAMAGGAENIGFAIPINDVKGLIKSVTEKGKLLRPYLGVRYVSLTDDYAYEFNLSVNRGAYIVSSAPGQPSILSGSPAEKAGLKEKDIITKVNDIAIDENNSLTSVLGRFSVDEEVKLTILRDAKEQTLNVKLEAAPTE